MSRRQSASTIIQLDGTGSEPPITLVDNTVSRQSIERSETESESILQTPTARSSRIKRNVGRSSIREGINRRKYAKWRDESLSNVHTAQDSSADNETSQDGTRKQRPWRTRRDSKRPKNKAELAKIDLQKENATAEYDVLYENQRGFFLFGIPLFSKSSLLNLDPAGWQNSQFKPSLVDITNAQVPDPSWTWAWKSWYVDMSSLGDVDEEGFQYGFSFHSRWHGTHPWHHSFVRRRRWIRKRVRKASHRTTDQLSAPDKRRLDEAHALTADYFTIHTRRRSQSPGTALSPSEFAETAPNPAEIVETIEDIGNIPSLFHYLKFASIDRQKLSGINHFIDHSGDELYFLAEKMPSIMAFLVFQSSRRQLLTSLINKMDILSESQSVSSNHDSNKSGTSGRRAQYMRAAMTAADEQVKLLDYWSDIRDMTRQGNALDAVNDKSGWTPDWEGLDASGPDSRVTGSIAQSSQQSEESSFATARQDGSSSLQNSQAGSLASRRQKLMSSENDSFASAQQTAGSGNSSLTNIPEERMQESSHGVAGETDDGKSQLSSHRAPSPSANSSGDDDTSPTQPRNDDREGQRSVESLDEKGGAMQQGREDVFASAD